MTQACRSGLLMTQRSILLLTAASFFLFTPTIAEAVQGPSPVPTPTVASCSGVNTGEINGSSPTFIGRLFRSGTPTTCGGLVSASMFDQTGARGYGIHEIKNFGATPACAAVTMQPTATSGTLVHQVAYAHGLFNPSSLASNVVGDPGSSVGQGGSSVMNVTIPPASSIDVVVLVITPGGTATYEITASDCSTGLPISINQPSEVSPYGRLLLQASGGDGHFHWTMETNQSGASIDDAGNYTAGALANREDVVRVTDNSSNTATAIVKVGDWAPLVVASTGSGTLPPRGAKKFTASGGLPPYYYALVSNASLGSISGTGDYLAGRRGNVSDLIRVTDSAGGSITASVAISAAMTISPALVKAPPRGKQTFIATGGSGSDPVWSFVTNDSGGTIDPSTGVYQAGTRTYTTDIVRAQDTLGNYVEASISVGGGLALSPPSAAVSSNAVVSFEAVGGSNAFSWKMKDAPSGGSIDSAGHYVAGPIGGVQDIVEVADSAGNSLTATVDIFPNAPAPASSSSSPSAPEPSTTPPTESSTASNNAASSSSSADDGGGCAQSSKTSSSGSSWLPAVLLAALAFVKRRR